MKFITKEKFENRINHLKSINPAYDHWTDGRWAYHSLASALAQLINPSSVLELGTMGVKVCDFSDEMDFPIADFWPIGSPKYLHNAKICPWPINNKSYDLFIALRVFHHLNPFQRECFLEAKRIANSIIITLPIDYSHTNASKILNINDFILFNDGIPPNVFSETENEYLFGWVNI